MKTEKISSSFRRRPWRRYYVLCAVECCSKLEALRRRTRGRRVSSQLQLVTVTVTKSKMQLKADQYTSTVQRYKQIDM